MTFLEFFLQQLEEEAATTRKMLSRVPTDKFNWKPHDKSMEMKRLAVHIAELPTWITMTLDTDELDFAKNEYKQEPVQNTEELIAYFENCLVKGRQSLKNGHEKDLDKQWHHSIFHSSFRLYNYQQAFELSKLPKRYQPIAGFGIFCKDSLVYTCY